MTKTTAVGAVAAVVAVMSLVVAVSVVSQPTTTAPATAPSRCSYGGSPSRPLPDRACTPGLVRTLDVSVVCTPGTAADARRVTATQKRKAAEDYGVKLPFEGEIDHLISLQLGGSNDGRNLWPQSGRVPNSKDAIEGRLHDWVCADHSVTRLRAAQRAIAVNWTTAERIIK